MEKKDRIICFTFHAIAFILIIVIVYFNYRILTWHSTRTFKGLSAYLPYFVNIISAFFCSLLLQGEEIFKIGRQKKSLFIRWELIILGIIALLFAIIKIWFAIFLNDAASVIIQSINISMIWQIAYMFAAGMFFVRAFHIKTDSSGQC